MPELLREAIPEMERDAIKLSSEADLLKGSTHAKNAYDEVWHSIIDHDRIITGAAVVVGTAMIACAAARGNFAGVLERFAGKRSESLGSVVTESMFDAERAGISNLGSKLSIEDYARFAGENVEFTPRFVDSKGAALDLDALPQFSRPARPISPGNLGAPRLGPGPGPGPGPESMLSQNTGLEGEYTLADAARFNAERDAAQNVSASIRK